ncbi:MAG: phosphate ABC transporter permease PstA [Gammaproteobacteria bacterium]|nr:phosphate ABC transporter permease PstA [Gammaproteobacteria bacterium]
MLDTSAIHQLVRRNRQRDAVFAIIGLACMMIGILTLAVLLAGLIDDGARRLNWSFFENFPSRRAARAGILSAIVGSSLVMLITALTAIPLGVGAGIYLEEYARRNWFTALVEINVTNLAGVPSIIYGLLALGLFVYALDFGQSILSAGLTLALMILPVIIVSTREAIRAIPAAIREAGYALGASRWQLVRDHILPYSAGGILTGIIIGLARAIGETAPIITIGALTFIAFLPDAPFTAEFPFISFEWIKSPFTVMPIQMFNWLSRPQAAFQENAAAAGLVLVVMTLVMNGLAIWLRIRFRKRIKW